MSGIIWGLHLWIWIGVGVGVFTGICAAFCISLRIKHSKAKGIGSFGKSGSSIPFHDHGSDSTIGVESPRTSDWNNLFMWLEKPRRSSAASAFGVVEISYKILRAATSNFTTVIGQGSFGPVYKAQMGNGESVAVKVLAVDSRQGAKEFITEVLLSGRLNHRNIVSLVGYCAERGKHMLVYAYMSNGSLASHLYNDGIELVAKSLHSTGRSERLGVSASWSSSSGFASGHKIIQHSARSIYESTGCGFRAVQGRDN